MFAPPTGTIVSADSVQPQVAQHAAIEMAAEGGSATRVVETRTVHVKDRSAELLHAHSFIVAGALAEKLC